MTKPIIKRMRWRVLVMLFLLSVVTYLDRVCISTTAPAMMKDLGLSPLQMGWVFSIFIFGYALFEIPGGWMGDHWGARSVLTRIVLWWSFFTAATALAWSYASLLVIRLLFGVGEAGAFPNCASAIARWFPPTERGRTQGTLLTGTRLGGALAPGFVVVLMGWLGWRQVFTVFAGLGAVWTVIWYWWYRNTPEEHRSVNPEELAEIRGNLPLAPARSSPVDWRALLRSRNLWAICAMYSGYSFGLYFYLTWLPTYLLRARGVSLAGIGFWAGLPLLFGAGSNVLGGFVSDWLARRSGLRWGRRLPAGLGLLLSALLLLVSLALQRPVAALLAMVASFACADVILGPAWATCLDIGKDHAGTITGCMNSFGQIGGMLSPVLFGWAVERWGSWNVPLLVTAACYFMSAAMWLVIDPEKPLVLSTPGTMAVSSGEKVFSDD
jgi:MFS transporter, ACS family, glucarate transporter